MRIGSNPNHHKAIDVAMKSHRVIIPVYIPNAEGYFADAFNVFQVCMESLLQTVNADTAISIISNGSSDEVNAYIFKLWEDKKIDRAVFNKDNIGKMNAIITETRASFEEFITYSDADVFFDKGWLKQTFSMFRQVKKAGFVSMNPTPLHYSSADSTLLGNLFSVFNKQKTNTICTYDDLLHFHKSIGKDQSHTDRLYNSDIVCVGKNEKYIVGAGHFCCTIRKTPTLKFVPKVYSNISVSGGSETVYLDTPFDKTGLWRLSSPKAYVWHMGNILEKEWADEKLQAMDNFREDDFRFSSLPFRNNTLSSKLVPYVLKNKVVALLKKIKII